MSGIWGRQREVFDGPAVYRICVYGRIEDRAAANYLPQMEITVAPLEGGDSVTTLMGELRDQTALRSVMDALYEWRFPVLSLQRLSIGPVNR